MDGIPEWPTRPVCSRGRLLNTIIHEVQAQAGKHIEQEHAQHLVLHAQMVMQALKKGYTKEVVSTNLEG